MEEQPLQTEVWLFPIYKYGTKKFVPMKYALILAYAVPTLFIILLSPLVTTNALLYQIEYILVAFFYGLLGVLTRSKLRSFLNIIPAAASYITIEFLIQPLFNFRPPINDPYAALSVASGPIKDLLNSYTQTQNIAWITQYFFIFDLLIIFIMANLIGFLTATISTGFWNPKGQFSVFAVVVKAIVIPLTLILIILLPLFFHGVASFVDGGSYFFAGANELSLAFSGGSSGTGAQVGSLDLKALQEHANKAAYYLTISNDKFTNLRGNILLQGILGYLTSNYPSLEPFRNITAALSLVGSLAEISYVLPELMLGFNSLTDGFNLTLGYITQASDTYNNNFAKGLNELTYAFDNFSIAWDKMGTDNQHHGLEQAIFKANSLKKIEAISNYLNITKFTSALTEAVGTLLTINTAFVQFLNGTYETTIGLANLGENKLIQTNYWMDSAIQDFILSNATLGNITVPEPVVFEIYPNGDGGATQVQSIEIPISGIVQLAKDFNNLLIYFTYAAYSSINLFDGLDGVLGDIGSVNWNSTSSAADPAFWTSLSNNMTKVNENYNYGLNNLSIANDVAFANAQHSYGKLLDPVFKNGANSFSNLFGGLVTDLQDKFTDYGYLINATTFTIYAFRDFSYGSNQFNSWLTLYNDNGNSYNSTINATAALAIANFTSSMAFAYNGYGELQQTVNINAQVKDSWSAMLYSPLNNGTITDASLSGADFNGIVIINTVANPSNDPILNIVVQLALSDVLGSG